MSITELIYGGALKTNQFNWFAILTKAQVLLCQLYTIYTVHIQIYSALS